MLGIVSSFNGLGYINCVNNDFAYKNQKENNVFYKEGSSLSLLHFENVGFINYGSCKEFAFEFDFSFTSEEKIYFEIFDENNFFTLNNKIFDKENNCSFFNVNYYKKSDNFIALLNVYSYRKIENGPIESKRLYCSCYDDCLIFNDNCFDSNDLEYNAYCESLIEEEQTIKSNRALRSSLYVSDMPVSLRVFWTDSYNKKHRAYGLYVELFDKSGLGGSLIPVSSGYLDKNGEFSTTYSYLMSASLFFKVYIKSRAAVPLNLFDVCFTTDTITTGSLGLFGTYDYTIGNSTDKEKKVSIVEALTWAHEYLETKTNTTIRPITYSFPCNGTDFSSWIELIRLMDDDYCDWDVIMHEYGHFVEHYLGFSSGSGGDHSGQDSLSEERNDFNDGNGTAWSEGFATYFSMSCQNEMQLDKLNILSAVGKNELADSTYTDNLPSGVLEYDYKNSSDIVQKGEACETTICAFLLGLADDKKVSTISDNFYYGYQEIWDIVVDNKAKSLSDFIRVFHDRHLNDLKDLGKFEEYLKLSPTIVTIGSFNCENAEFKWTLWNSNKNFPQNLFSLVFYNSRNKVIFETPQFSRNKGYALNYYLSRKEIGNLLTSHSDTIYWQVVAYANYDGTTTGPYYSNVGSFNINEMMKIEKKDFGFEPQYFFYSKTKTIKIGSYTVTTNRLRTGFIEEQCIVLSANRKNAGDAYLELDFSSPIRGISVDVSLWSSSEGFNYATDTAYIQSYDNSLKYWATDFDLFNDITISKNRSIPNRIGVAFNKAVNKIRFKVNCKNPSGDRNKGRVCLGDLYVY